MTNQIELTDRTRATRNKLLAVAREVFEADGYDGASVSRIVEAAQVSRGTFYLYFDSKEDVFRAVADTLQADIMKAQEWPVDDPPQEILRKSTERFLRFYRDNALMMAVLDQVATHAPEFKSLRLTMRRATARRATRFIRDLQSRGLASPTIDADYAGVALNGMIDRFANVWFVLGEDFEMDAAVTTLTELWVRSIGATYTPPN
jgi:AcrR family transcriptional regulator